MSDSEGLQRQLGLFPATAMVIGGMIAVGIFLVPAGMAKSLGSPLLVLIVWVVMAAMALSGSLCYGELAARFPNAGGGYVYLREAFGPLPAFLYGWMSMTAMDPGITATLATGMASYLNHIVPLGDVGMKIAGIGAVLALAVVNIVGVRLGAWLIVVLTVFKIGVLAVIALMGVGLGLGDWANLTPFTERRLYPDAPPLFDALAGGLVGAFFAFAGWWDLSKLAGEVKEPAKTLPRALMLAVGLVTLTYVVTSMVFMYLVPIDMVMDDETFAAQAGAVLFGRSGGVIFSVIVILSVIGSIAGLLMAAPRVYYAMARDRVFFNFAAVIHPRFGTPARAIAIQAGLACVLVALGTFETILNYFIFIAVLFVALTVVGLFFIRRHHPNVPPYRTPGYPVTPVLFLLLVTVLLALLMGHSPTQALMGVGVVAVGIPVYYLLFRKP
ncbi:MAG: amino acid permease [candidate division Zixibacteria bacterium]|nr:amino acid permease [candidate division Zixibacteria bacterium]